MSKRCSRCSTFLKSDTRSEFCGQLCQTGQNPLNFGQRMAEAKRQLARAAEKDAIAPSDTSSPSPSLPEAVPEKPLSMFDRAEQILRDKYGLQ